ncbi:hypothetical protein LZK75_36855 (plasmid) [Rhizobium leguminosarum]|nr:hypothetical protein LZK75_36855 [Rhizobium leguminosarum]
MSGADLARMVRDAKKRARREDRHITLADLISQLPPVIRIEGEYRHAVAVHEAGHAVVGNALGLGQFVGVAVVHQINPRIEINRRVVRASNSRPYIFATSNDTAMKSAFDLRESLLSD